MRVFIVFFFLFLMLLFSCKQQPKETGERELFPDKLVKFSLVVKDSIFAGTGSASWDKMIRERGFIIKEDDDWKLYYSGYNPDSSDMKYLGLAVSDDGIHWKRYSDRPIFSGSWVEDMSVVKHNGKYYMFAEGLNDRAHMLISDDGIHWTEKGRLDIRKTDGSPISKGRFGTPTVWIENGIWYLFYERRGRGVWLATSSDAKQWKNVSDEPVLKMGPESYDKYALSMDCLIKYKGLYYGYYHASDKEDRSRWTVNVAVSKDLIHWDKYPNNPIIDKNNRSSSVLVRIANGFRLYTMHPAVYLYVSKSN